MRFEVRGDASLLQASSQASAPSTTACRAQEVDRRAALLLRPFASIAAAAAAAAAPLPLKERTTGTLFNGEVDYCAGQRGCPVITGAG